MPVAVLSALQQQTLGNPFFELFPHRFDYIYAPYPDPWTSPQWQTERRHPLTDRLLQQGSYLYGVRFETKTGYCLLDIDSGSAYHPQTDPLAISRIMAALEPLGLVAYVACRSSDSGGLHLYLPFPLPQSSWQIGATVSALLETAGFKVKPGQLEVFPNRKDYSVQGKPNLFNAHRLPLQVGSYLLNQAFEPIWSDQQSFVRHWQQVQHQNDVTGKTLQRLLKQSRRQYYRVSGKAAKFLNDLDAEIEAGWTGPGQTNYLLGRIAMRAYIFHHILAGGAPLSGTALVEQIIRTAKALPGYQDWCQHQHELDHRAEEWASCIENSKYFPYGVTRNHLQSNQTELEEPGLTWNQQQCADVRKRIQNAIADLLNQNVLPGSATARFKALTQYGISGSSLYRHKDLWHPEFLTLSPEDLSLENLSLENLSSEDLSLEALERTSLETAVEKSVDNPVNNFAYNSRVNEAYTNWSKDLGPVGEPPKLLILHTNLTSLFLSLGCNPFDSKAFNPDQSAIVSSIGCNSLLRLGFGNSSSLKRVFKPP